jgi:hypothetical protein
LFFHAVTSAKCWEKKGEKRREKEKKRGNFKDLKTDSVPIFPYSRELLSQYL